MTIPLKIRKQINGLCRRVNARPPFILSPIRRVVPDLENPIDPAGHLAIIGTREFGFENTGKLNPQNFLYPFHLQLSKAHNIACYYYQSCEDMLLDLNRHDGLPIAAVLVYGEDKKKRAIPNVQLVDKLQDIRPDCMIFNHPRTGLTLRDKKATNILLRRNRIPTPRIIHQEGYCSQVFSNSRTGSGSICHLVSDGTLPDGRYNTEYIDTRLSIDGRMYFCSLRAISVGENLLDFWPRFRPASDGCPSVHTRDTPPDVHLLKVFYNRISPLRRRAHAICKQLNDALGPGFYAHDMLYSPRDDRLLVCESGFKFDSFCLVKHLGDLCRSVSWLKLHASDRLPAMAADALAHTAFEVERRGLAA